MAKKRFFRCPHCRARVRRGALACPKCGSDKETGWSRDPYKWAGDIPTGYGDEEFDYDEFVEDEFPDHAPRRSWGIGLHIFWGIVAVLGGAALLYYALGR